MLTIVQRGGATHEKPPETVRGTAARLPWAWDGLCFAVPFNDSTQNSARDLVANAAPSAAAGLAWTRDNRGNVAASLGTSSYLAYPDNPQHNKPTTAITAYVRLRRTGTADAAGGVFTKRISDADPWSTWQIYAPDSWPTGLGGYLCISGSDLVDFPMDYTMDLVQWYSVFVRWSTGTVPVIHILNERGTILDSASYAGGAVSGTLTYQVGEPIHINASEVTGTNNFADYSQVMAWSRRLTDTELQALVADPYGWYSPRRETIGLSSPYPLAFGGGEMRFGTGSGGLR
jgi:hypothetical protein